jgi:hypothetical protein
MHSVNYYAGYLWTNGPSKYLHRMTEQVSSDMLSEYTEFCTSGAPVLEVDRSRSLSL